MSDLHDRYPSVTPCAPVLALLGDIGDPESRLYSSFLREMSRQFEYVLVVMGNHECYSRTKTEAEMLIRQACQSAGPNVHFLNRSSIIINGYNIAGATLWSDITDAASSHVNCFKRIKEITPSLYRQWFQEDLTFLSEEGAKKNTIFMTHYAPLMKCNGCYSESESSSAFATDLEHLFNTNIKAHLFGHTHVNGTWFCNGVPIMSNCKGYFPGECKGESFNSKKVLHLL